MGIATAAVSTGASIYEGQQAQKQQQKALDLQKQQGDLQQQQQQRAAIRQSRIAYANAQSAAENQGVADSSSAIGGQGSIESQLSGNLSFLDTMGGLSDQASDALGKAAAFKQNASDWGQVASTGVFAAENSTKISNGISNVFAPDPTSWTKGL